jgi:hypothetical protein
MIRNEESPTTTGATFSPCRTYRYALWRAWDFRKPTLIVIGLNPSTADERQDDPTIRRCVNFAKRIGCGRCVMLNLFGLRATDPKVMKAHPEPVGPENDAAIAAWAALGSARIVAAWGVHGAWRNRDTQVCCLLKSLDAHLECFGTTKYGYPRHPLYVPNGAQLARYRRSSFAPVSDAPWPASLQ